jgi:flagellar basal body-associated protein FliL
VEEMPIPEIAILFVLFIVLIVVLAVGASLIVAAVSWITGKRKGSESDQEDDRLDISSD